METVGVAAGVVSASVALLGLIWTVAFGQRNLVDMMTSRRSKPTGTPRPKREIGSPMPASSTPVPADTPHNASALPPQDHEPDTDENMTLYHRWLALTGMLVVGCWARGAEFDWVTPDWEFPIITGCALRWLLILPVVFLVPGIFFTLISLPFGTHSDGFGFGTGLLAAFLATLVAEFFIVGIMSIVGFVLALLPDKTLEQAMDAIED